MALHRAMPVQAVEAPLFSVELRPRAAAGSPTLQQLGELLPPALTRPEVLVPWLS